ncbi:alcohol dehydrogenase GroES domain protein [Klebsiella michiganensis]|nr:alcohol dehydrogenase GroES domain protein [Klebsiella michiganensis]
MSLLLSAPTRCVAPLSSRESRCWWSAAGPIGLGAAAIAKADGAQVVVADTSPARCDHVAQHLGLATLDPSDPQFTERLCAAFGGSLAQKVIDATGNQQAMNNTVNLIRHGGSIIFVGLFKGELQIPDPEFHKKETTMMGSRNATEEDFCQSRAADGRGESHRPG